MPKADDAKLTSMTDSARAIQSQGRVPSPLGPGGPEQGAILPPGTTQGQPKPSLPGLWSTVTQGVRSMITGSDPYGWFGPGQPIAPVAQKETQGRAFDFTTGANYRIQPRAEEATSFSQLRALADQYDLLRIVIETRKDQFAKMEWDVRMRDKRGAPDEARLSKLRKLFAYPDNENDFHTWFRAILEDMLVTDAPTLEPRFNFFGELIGLDWIDGTTIRRVIDSYGRTPLPPDPAYQQVLKGMPANNLSRDQLIYKPRNLRTNKIYGFSPVEQIIVTVNIAMRRQIWQLQGYTEGNVPEAVVEMPENWSIDQVQQFQKWWDSLLEGNTAERRHMKFIPGPAKMTFTKPVDFKDEYDEWLARVVCYAFSVSPTAFIKQVNRATAESAQQEALQEGLAPLLVWSKSLFDYIIAKYFQWDDIVFDWKTADEADVLKQAQANDIYAKNGTLDLDEIREDLGRNSRGTPPGVMTPQGYQLLPTAVQPGNVAVDPTAQAEEAAADPEPDKPGKVDDAQKLSGLDNIDLEGRKLAKAAKKKVRIVRIKRQDLTEPQAKVQAAYVSLFHSTKHAIITQVREAYAKALPELQKGGGRAQRIVDQIEFEGWDAVLDPTEEEIEEVINRTGASTLAALVVGSDMDELLSQVSEVAVEYARTRSAGLIGKQWRNGKLVDNPNSDYAITDSTREMIRGKVATAIEEGWSAQELGQELDDAYAFSDGRAETIARTEMAYAHSAGNMVAYKASGMVQRKRSVLGSEHGGEPDECDENAEQGWIDLDDDFGSGDGEPPYHPNCVCDVEVEVASGPEENDDAA